MTTDVERCCANCAAWDRSSEEWEHKQWRDYVYRRVIEDIEHDKVQKEAWPDRWKRDGKPIGRTMREASCLGLGWGKWGVCCRDFGRGKLILCWDEKRGYNAPLYRYLVTAHDFGCLEWRPKAEEESPTEKEEG